jgi:ethanolaminephosphotransferase
MNKMAGFHSWATVIANLLVILGILTFSSGFFPYKPLIPGLATFDDTRENATVPAVFDKVIFMVIDALRRYDWNGLLHAKW